MNIQKVLKSVSLQDVTSGLAARILPGLASILAIPILVHVLGPEHYAGIGLFLTIQALAGLLDIGLATGIARQAAWLTGTNAEASKLWSLLRTFEIPYVAISILLLIAGIFGGRLFLQVVFNIDPQSIGLDRAGTVFLFVSIGLRFPFALYVGYLSGRGHIKAANIIFLVTELARIFGALALIVWIAPKLSIYFGWQVVIAVIATVTARYYCKKITPGPYSRSPRDWGELLEVRGVMLGASQMQILFVVANNLDKLLLPRFVSPANYGLYVAISQLAISNFLIVQPIWAAFHPRLISAMATNASPAVRQVFLSAVGLMVSLCGAFMIGTMVATPAILQLWIGPHDPHFDLVLIALSAGFGMVGLAHLALTIHQAATRYFPTPLIFTAAILVIPTLAYLILNRIDAGAVAVIWSLVYCVLLLAGALTFRLYAPQLLRLWLVYVLGPFFLALIVGALLSFWTHGMSLSAQLILAPLCAALALLSSLIVNPGIRHWVRFHMGIDPR